MRNQQTVISTPDPKAIAFLAEHNDSLGAALDHVLFYRLYKDGVFINDEDHQAYRILYQFKRLLIPPPEMDV